MRVRARPGVDVAVLEDGRLELTCPASGSRFRCSAISTAMWIALLQQGGRPDAAAALLAKHWDLNPEYMQSDFSLWIEELRAAGLLQIVA